MAFYNVTIVRQKPEYATVEIEADFESVAKQIALDQAYEGQFDFEEADKIRYDYEVAAIDRPAI